MFNAAIPFTTLSKTCLDENKSQYPNVYLKGALINMCIDLKLRVLSNGEYGIQNMMQDLAKKYGIEKGFKDKKLFKEIGKVTGFRKEMKDFFARYVAGAEPLPIKELMAEMGIEYQEKGVVKELSMFGFSPNTGITFNFAKKMIELRTDGIDPFGRDILGFKGGDLLYKWQGSELSMENLQGVLTQHAMTAKEGKELAVTVLRKNSDGDYEEVELKGALATVPTHVEHFFAVKKDASDQQMKLRKAWLGNYFSAE